MRRAPMPFRKEVNMNNKLLIGVVVVIAAALIFESAYLLGSRQQQVNL
jgi:hypothetical protein